MLDIKADLRILVNMNVDTVIATLRRRLNALTQLELAEELGISQQYLCDILAGRRAPGPRVLKALGLRREIIYKNTA